MLPVDFAQAHPDAAAALVGRRLWWPSNYDDVPGASPLERAYTQFGPTDADNEVLHLNRFHDTPFCPVEVRCCRELLAEITPGLVMVSRTIVLAISGLHSSPRVSAFIVCDRTCTSTTATTTGCRRATNAPRRTRAGSSRSRAPWRRRCRRRARRCTMTATRRLPSTTGPTAPLRPSARGSSG